MSGLGLRQVCWKEETSAILGLGSQNTKLAVHQLVRETCSSSWVLQAICPAGAERMRATLSCLGWHFAGAWKTQIRPVRDSPTNSLATTASDAAFTEGHRELFKGQHVGIVQRCVFFSFAAIFSCRCRVVKLPQRLMNKAQSLST